MANLPVGVGQRRLQSCFHFVAFERGQREHGPTADRGLVVARGQHRRERRRITLRTERSDGSLSDQRIRMRARGAYQRVDRGPGRTRMFANRVRGRFRAWD